VAVYDIAGKLIYEDKKPGNNHTVSLTGNACGVYLLKIKVGEKGMVKRIAVDR
jgi:hypothetical protein